eukprot:COSAG04_NODE_4302_length_2172_cov_1.568259_3_plen_78_part_00
MFNEHISDNFPGDGATGMLMYMEHLPFIDSLVTGEVFDCECRERSAWTDRDCVDRCCEQTRKDPSTTCWKCRAYHSG